MGRTLGQADDPLLVSVRSGAKFSMPGMMETVLNVGLNDESVHGLAATAGGDERFAWDSYRRLLQMFGTHRARHRAAAVRTRRSTRLKAERGRHERPRPRRRRPARPGRDVQAADRRARPAATSRRTRASSCDLAVRAVFDSWNTERAVLYRRQERIPDDLGTAVNICAMVFGNLGEDSGTGVALHPRPGDRRTRASTATTCRTPRARTSSPASATPSRSPTSSRSTRRRTTSCCDIMATLEQPLPRPVRHRVHRRARQALDAADPGRQAHRRGGVPDRRASSSTRASSTWTRRCGGSPATSSPS